MDKYVAVVGCAPKFALRACMIRTPRCTSGGGTGSSARLKGNRNGVCFGKRRRSLFPHDCVTPAEFLALLLRRRYYGDLAVGVSDFEIRKRDETMAPQWIRLIV